MPLPGRAGPASGHDSLLIIVSEERRLCFESLATAAVRNIS